MNLNFKDLKIVSEFEVYQSENELSLPEKNLLQQAKKGLNNAYAPYSKFLVCAAVLLENNEIIIGNNQENAAYPSGLCAERVAIFYASSKFPNVAIKAIAVVCKANNKDINEVVSPCGACRQAIAEYETRDNKEIRIIMPGENSSVYVAKSIQNLLPLMFNGKCLK